jgi:hypothetical protein
MSLATTDVSTDNAFADQQLELLLSDTYIHTYHSRFIPPIAEASQIFLRDAHVLPKLLIYEESYRRDRW